MSMSASDWDILVVGAGPAGSSAALSAACKGARVLLVERRRKVGLPVQCAEYIPAMLKGELGLKDNYVVQKIKGMRTFVPGHTVKKMAAPGYIIRRELFDQALVRAAQKIGVNVRPATRAVAIDPAGKVTLSPKNGSSYTIHPKVIIGADGPHSMVGRCSGAVNHHLLPGVQMTLPLKEPMEYTEVYFDPQIVAGYAWLFPKGKNANVGLAMLRPGNAHSSIRKILEKFIKRLKTDEKIKGNPVAYTAGWIPVEKVRNAVKGNMMLVGDAAGHTHPITGAGIFAAVTCGKLAGKYAAAAVRENDMRILKHYDLAWQDLFGETLTRAHHRRKQMEKGWAEFDTIVKKCWVAYGEYYA